MKAAHFAATGRNGRRGKEGNKGGAACRRSLTAKRARPDFSCTALGRGASLVIEGSA